MNREAITLEDCLDMYEKRNKATIINDGQVIMFISENKEKEFYE